MDKSMLLSKSFCLEQSANTPLTPNSMAAVSVWGDVDQDTTVMFQTQSVTYWNVLVSNANTQVILTNDRGTSVVIFKKGLDVQFTALSQGQYMVQVSGDIIDDDTLYALTGKNLGIFSLGQQQ